MDELEKDLAIRDYWKGYLRDRSLEVLAERFGVSDVGIWKIESAPMRRLTAGQNDEIQKLRAQYRHAKAAFMPRFRVAAIAKRHGVSTHLIVRRRQKWIREKAGAFYAERMAA